MFSSLVSKNFPARRKRRRPNPSARLFREISESEPQAKLEVSERNFLGIAEEQELFLGTSLTQKRSKNFLSLVHGFNAGGTADFILIISVPGYFSIPGLFRSPGYDTASERRMKNGTGKRSKTDRNTGT